METSNLRSMLVFSAILALGIGEGSASLQVPAGRSFPDAGAPVDGTVGSQEREDGKASDPQPERPAREEKTDCDDCVIVEADEASEGRGAAGGLLASTLWGLFAVSRPKRIPRTIIRGVTVP